MTDVELAMIGFLAAILVVVVLLLVGVDYMIKDVAKLRAEILGQGKDSRQSSSGSEPPGKKRGPEVEVSSPRRARAGARMSVAGGDPDAEQTQRMTRKVKNYGR